jgi:alpha-amylase
MAPLTSISDIDLTPIPGKQYFSLAREWREEFIYFLLIDRFHDDNSRSPVYSRTAVTASARRTIFSAARSKRLPITSIT